MASLRDYWPQLSAVLQFGLPLLFGALSAQATREGVMKGWKVCLPLLLTFPLLWARGPSLPGPAAWAVPFACWLVALFTARSPRLALRALCLLATGVSTAALQLWQLLL